MKKTVEEILIKPVVTVTKDEFNTIIYSSKVTEMSTGFGSNKHSLTFEGKRYNIIF